MVKRNLVFCVKTLALYSILGILIYCPMMQNEQKYDENSVGAMLDAIGGDDIPSSDAGIQDDLYPYAKVMNLMEQCRALESEFRLTVVDFVPTDDKNVEAVKALLAKTEKLAERLRQEMTQFSDYVSSVKLHSSENDKLQYSCADGKCRYVIQEREALLSHGEAVSRNERSKRVMLYTRKVLRRNIAKINFIANALTALIERVKREEEAALQLSRNQAKEIIPHNLIPPHE